MSNQSANIRTRDVQGSVNTSRRRWTFSLRTLLLVFIMVGIVAYCATGVYQWKEQPASEYNTVTMIRRVGQYISSNHGQWPMSWTDITDVAFARRHVRIRFDVDTAELIRDPELIQTVITPISGEYHTYPHAHSHLEELRGILAANRTTGSGQASATNSPAP